MSSIDLIQMGIKNLWRRKLRTFLTILGVIIGTSSIITMLSLGFGMSEGFKAQLSQMGSLNVINVVPNYGEWDTPQQSSGGKSTNTALNDQAVGKFSSFKGVEAVTPILETQLKFVSGKNIGYVGIKGIDPETMEAFDFKVTEGRLLSSSDTFNIVFGGGGKNMFYDGSRRNRYGGFEESKVDLMKDKLEMSFDMNFGEKTPPRDSSNTGTTPSIKHKVYKVKVVGILMEGDWEKDYYAFMNINQLKKIINENNKNNRDTRGSGRHQDQSYQRVLVKVKDIKDVENIQVDIKAMGFNTYSLMDQLNAMKKTSSTLQAVLGGIGAISLLVAALGITNTMVMSIYERTREIGIMKVIGASLADIKKLFLFESGMIGFLGGLFGVIFSKIISMIINTVGQRFFNFLSQGGVDTDISIIPIWLMVVALSFSSLVGLISGYYPARRAMKLSALEAIKTE